MSEKYADKSEKTVMFLTLFIVLQLRNYLFLQQESPRFYFTLESELKQFYIYLYVLLLTPNFLPHEKLDKCNTVDIPNPNNVHKRYLWRAFNIQERSDIIISFQLCLSCFETQNVQTDNLCFFCFAALAFTNYAIFINLSKGKSTFIAAL